LLVPARPIPALLSSSYFERINEWINEWMNENGCFVKHFVAKNNALFSFQISQSHRLGWLRLSLWSRVLPATDKQHSDDILATNTPSRLHAAWALVCIIVTKHEPKTGVQNWMNTSLNCCLSADVRAYLHQNQLQHSQFPTGIWYRSIPSLRESRNICGLTCKWTVGLCWVALFNGWVVWRFEFWTVLCSQALSWLVVLFLMIPYNH